MRAAVFLIALFFIIVGIVGLVSPDSLMMIRQQYLSGSIVGLYTACTVRASIGLVLILFAPASRAPKTLRVLGVVACLQGLAALLGVDRVRTIQEWEGMHTAFLRAGAVLALAMGGFLAFDATKPSDSR